LPMLWEIALQMLWGNSFADVMGK